MDLCLMIEGQEGVTWPQWLALAQACEANGVPALFRSDHQLNLAGRTERGSLDAWATITALAAHTTTLRLGTLVSPVTFRHPSDVAKVAVAADHVSGGRVELGLGAGWHEREHAAYGFPFPPLKVRMDMLAEQLEIVHGHWADGRVLVRGRALPARGPRRRAEAGPASAPAAADGRQGRSARRGAGRPLGGRVQHPVRGARRRRRDEGSRHRGMRGRRPRADPVLADDRRAGRPRPRRAARPRAAAGRAQRGGRGARRLPRLARAGVDRRHRRRGRRAARRAARRRPRAGDVPAAAPRATSTRSR